MDVKVGEEERAIIAEAMETGRYASEEDVVGAGLRLIAQRERALEELKASLQGALERGGSHSSEEVMANVRARLAARRHVAE